MTDTWIGPTVDLSLISKHENEILSNELKESILRQKIDSGIEEYERSVLQLASRLTCVAKTDLDIIASPVTNYENTTISQIKSYQAPPPFSIGLPFDTLQSKLLGKMETDHHRHQYDDENQKLYEREEYERRKREKRDIEEMEEKKARERRRRLRGIETGADMEEPFYKFELIPMDSNEHFSNNKPLSVRIDDVNYILGNWKYYTELDGKHKSSSAGSDFHNLRNISRNNLEQSALVRSGGYSVKDGRLVLQMKTDRVIKHARVELDIMNASKGKVQTKKKKATRFFKKIVREIRGKTSDNAKVRIYETRKKFSITEWDLSNTDLSKFTTSDFSGMAAIFKSHKPYSFSVNFNMEKSASGNGPIFETYPPKGRDNGTVYAFIFDNNNHLQKFVKVNGDFSTIKMPSSSSSSSTTTTTTVTINPEQGLFTDSEVLSFLTPVIESQQSSNLNDKGINAEYMKHIASITSLESSVPTSSPTITQEPYKTDELSYFSSFMKNNKSTKSASSDTTPKNGVTTTTNTNSTNDNVVITTDNVSNEKKIISPQVTTTTTNTTTTEKTELYTTTPGGDGNSNNYQNLLDALGTDCGFCGEKSDEIYSSEEEEEEEVEEEEEGEEGESEEEVALERKRRDKGKEKISNKKQDNDIICKAFINKKMITGKSTAEIANMKNWKQTIQSISLSSMNKIQPPIAQDVETKTSILSLTKKIPQSILSHIDQMNDTRNNIVFKKNGPSNVDFSISLLDTTDFISTNDHYFVIKPKTLYSNPTSREIRSCVTTGKTTNIESLYEEEIYVLKASSFFSIPTWNEICGSIGENNETGSSCQLLMLKTGSSTFPLSIDNKNLPETNNNSNFKSSKNSTERRLYFTGSKGDNIVLLFKMDSSSQNNDFLLSSVILMKEI